MGIADKKTPLVPAGKEEDLETVPECRLNGDFAQRALMREALIQIYA